MGRGACGAPRIMGRSVFAPAAEKSAIRRVRARSPRIAAGMKDRKREKLRKAAANPLTSLARVTLCAGHGPRQKEGPRRGSGLAPGLPF